MTFDDAFTKALIGGVSRTVIEHAEELTALDQAIGDGDHGINMKRGFEAVLGEADAFAAKPLPEAVKAVGMQLVMKVGGASGPLYGTLFMTLGKELPEAPALEDTEKAFGAAIAAVMARGKSKAGQKTMLDVLVPVHERLAAGGADLLTALPDAADAAAEATIPMKAEKGRASFLGDRSIGHMDPGARSSALILRAVCQAIGERR
jgi:phosphoenolpyruvate---glycerone phosphotransferase subunit DhaL